MNVEELDKMCIELIELEKVKKKQAEELKQTNKKINSLQFKLADIFQEHGKIENSGEWGKVKINIITEFKPSDEEKVYSWLKKENRFEDLAKIHAGTLKRVIKEEVIERREKAKDSGSEDPTELFWLPDGVEERDTLKVKVSEE